MTTLPPHTWEQSLLTLAHEAWQSRLMSAPKPQTDQPLLDRAYAHCEAITAQHSKSFHLATSLLIANMPPRPFLQALYERSMSARRAVVASQGVK